MRPRWVTVEGINGVGKTQMVRRLAQHLDHRCLLLDELTDLENGNLPGRVVTALCRTGGTFLRTGHPLTETFALLGLKVRDYECVQASANPEATIILEDRGIDSVALYQAAILGSEEMSLARTHALAQRIYATVARWRPPPDRTILLIDDVDTCVDRFERRFGFALSSEDCALVARISRLYALQAASEPGRIVSIDRAGCTDDDVFALVYDACVSA